MEQFYYIIFKFSVCLYLFSVQLTYDVTAHILIPNLRQIESSNIKPNLKKSQLDTNLTHNKAIINVKYIYIVCVYYLLIK